MANDNQSDQQSQAKPRYRWPWFVLAAFLAAIALAVLWMSHEVDRARRIRDANAPAAPSGNETNTGSVSDPTPKDQTSNPK
jgi:hypothetical protein